MLLYTKIVKENGKPVRKVYGTVENIPAETDEEVILMDADGDVLEVVEGDSYVTDNKGGIIRLSDGKFVAVNVARPEGDPVNVIPGEWEPAEKKVVSISVNAEEAKVEYTVGEELDLAGVEVVATYDDGDEASVTDFTSNPAAGTVLETVGETAVTIEFEGKEASYNIVVNAAQVEEQADPQTPVEPPVDPLPQQSI